MESNKTRPYEAAEGIATSPSGMSRRSFLAGAAAFGAGAAAFSLSLPSPQPAREIALANRLAVARGIRIMANILLREGVE